MARWNIKRKRFSMKGCRGSKLPHTGLLFLRECLSVPQFAPVSTAQTKVIMSIRRLPVYILADCSGSMNGAPIESVKSGIRALHSELMGDPSAVESAYLSVITFDSNAQQIVPLTEITQFNPPEIQAGGTAFGARFRFWKKPLIARCARRVRKRG